ncbi:hypothetical protein [Sneathiella glossodoripedis]|uniref:hypothetical protein n=1 Tax=Sneathiella glossodoripedis TaxID=418853 RepID=UPI00046F82E5|nr:hypothetical protein [Sneathiella glossodoripedis]
MDKKIKAYLDSLHPSELKFCSAIDCWCTGCIRNREVTPQDLTDYMRERGLQMEVQGPDVSQEAQAVISEKLWKKKKGE